MDDIGNLVYVLVFIIWFLSRLFGKGRKKPVTKPTKSGHETPDQDYQNTPGPTESTPPPVTFEDILRELTGAPSEKKPEPAIEIPETYYEDTYVDEPEHEEESTSFEVLETEYKPQTPSPFEDSGKFNAFDKKKSRSSKSARKAFRMMQSAEGARQAFIMKEIFDRKYK